MGLEDRDYFWEDRERRMGALDKKSVTYNPKEFRASTSRARDLHPPSLGEVCARPGAAWCLGLTIGALIGIASTLIIAVIDASLLDTPIFWAYKLVSVFR